MRFDLFWQLTIVNIRCNTVSKQTDMLEIVKSVLMTF